MEASPASSPPREPCWSGRARRTVATSPSSGVSPRRCPAGRTPTRCSQEHIVHDYWDEAAATEILRAAIAETGRLLVVEFVTRPGNEPDPAKFMDLNTLVMLRSRERTADDFGRLYAEAGFGL